MIAMRFYNLWLVVVLLVGFSGTAWAGELELIQHDETEDVYQVMVHPDVESFQVHLLFSDDPNNRVVTEIKVYRGEDILQTLPVEEMDPPYEGADYFTSADMNFDGFDDLQLLVGWGATGNQSWSHWLYNTEKGRFEFSEQLTSIGALGFDENNRILSWWDGGAGGDIYPKSLYSWQGRELVLVLDEYQTIDMNTGQAHKVVSELRDGKMVVVRDVIGKYEEELKQFHKVISEPRDGKMVVVRDVVRKYDEETGLVRWIVQEPRGGEMAVARDVLQDYDMQLDKTHQVVRELMDGKMEVVSDKMLNEEDALGFDWEGIQLEY